MDKYKTFAESEGKESFNWFKFLNQKEIMPKDWVSAQRISMDWVTCACGNQCSVIPRSDYNNAPMDYELRRLGYDFNSQILKRYKVEAIKTLVKIETRAAQLIYNLK
jgi:hypothetical protein